MTIEEDVKIYGEPTTTTYPRSEGEKSATLYLQHKENGNLDKCKELGALLAKTFLALTSSFIGRDFYSQKMVLIFFVMNSELKDSISDSLLLNSTQSKFDKILEKENSELFKIITDNTALTLYILDDRNGCGSCLGETFAELCQQDDNKELQEIAFGLIDEYSTLFSGIIHRYEFI